MHFYQLSLTNLFVNETQKDLYDNAGDEYKRHFANVFETAEMSWKSVLKRCVVWSNIICFHSILGHILIWSPCLFRATTNHIVVK